MARYMHFRRFFSQGLHPRWRRILLGFAASILFLFLMHAGIYFYYRHSVRNVVKYDWKISPDNEQYFRPVLSKQEKDDIVHLLQVFSDTMEKNRISYFMYAGTLLGSYRHLGPIPWDDDLDILVNIQDRGKVRKVLKTLEPGYKLFTGFQWKLYPDQKARTWWERWIRYTHNIYWPFLDTFFFAENATHVWDTAKWNTNLNTFMKKDVFPLTKRPFDNLRLYAPHDSYAALSTVYNVSECHSSPMNHKREERYYTIKKIACKELNVQFPFVQREKLQNGSMKETLAYGNGLVVRTVVV